MSIEILIQEVGVKDIVRWLNSRFTNIILVSQEKEMEIYQASINDSQVPIIIGQVEVPSYTSVWFNGSIPFWSSSKECAYEVSKALGKNVLCEPEGSEANLPGVYLQIGMSGKRIINIDS